MKATSLEELSNAVNLYADLSDIKAEEIVLRSDVLAALRALHDQQPANDLLTRTVLANAAMMIRRLPDAVAAGKVARFARLNHVAIESDDPDEM